MSIESDESDDVGRRVERAVESALELSWFADYGRWARDWLAGADRSAGSARTAFHRVRQWVDFGGDSWPARCCLNASAAAEELARGLHDRAERSADAAVRHAGFVRNPPPESDRPPGEPDLVFDDWKRDSSGAKRGRSYGPREV